VTVVEDVLCATKSADKGINLLTDAMGYVKQRDE
jgi:hypothetical protein